MLTVRGKSRTFVINVFEGNIPNQSFINCIQPIFKLLIRDSPSKEEGLSGKQGNKTISTMFAIKILEVLKNFYSFTDIDINEWFYTWQGCHR